MEIVAENQTFLLPKILRLGSSEIRLNTKLSPTFSVFQVHSKNIFSFSLQLFPGTFVNRSSFMEDKTKIRSLSKTPKTFCGDGANGF